MGMIYFYFVVIGIALLLALYRFLKGPTASDRIVALDTLTTISTALLVLLGLFFQRFIYIDVALIYGLLGFIGVLTVARYLEGGL
jgi:multicomponent Na+:H+ antiporter subunit F